MPSLWGLICLLRGFLCILRGAWYAFERAWYAFQRVWYAFRRAYYAFWGLDHPSQMILIVGYLYQCRGANQDAQYSDVKGQIRIIWEASILDTKGWIQSSESIIYQERISSGPQNRVWWLITIVNKGSRDKNKNQSTIKSIYSRSLLWYIHDVLLTCQL